jgi:hypothetical protein
MPMPITAPKVYNFKDVVCTVGPIPLSEYDAEGTLTVEAQSDEVESVLTADGLVHYSDNNDRRLRVTVTLMAKSLAHQSLMVLARAQVAARRAGAAPIAPLPFSLASPALGEILASPYTIFINIPRPTQGKQEPTREWVLELPYGSNGEVYALTEPPVLTV